MFLIVFSKVLSNKENEIELKKLFEENKTIHQFILKLKKIKKILVLLKIIFFYFKFIIY